MPVATHIKGIGYKSHKVGGRATSGTKVTKHKQPVQHSKPEKSSVVSEIDRLNAVISGLQKDVATLTANRAAKEDLFSNKLIPKPKVEVGRSGKNGQKARHKLRDAMGLTNDKELDNEVRVSPGLFFL
jgi:hypothetical protein